MEKRDDLSILARDLVVQKSPSPIFSLLSSQGLDFFSFFFISLRLTLTTKIFPSGELGEEFPAACRWLGDRRGWGWSTG